MVYVRFHLCGKLSKMRGEIGVSGDGNYSLHSDFLVPG
jgi:hypothetical protein